MRQSRLAEFIKCLRRPSGTRNCLATSAPPIEALESRIMLTLAAGVVREIDLNATLLNLQGGNQLTAVGDTLFFTNIINSFGDQDLWQSDGTSTGTVLVKHFAYKYSFPSPLNFTDFDGTLFFSGVDNVHSRQLWKSDGTEEGTVLVKDLNRGSAPSYPSDLTDVNGVLYFTANYRQFSSDLWKSDGTRAGTVLVKEIPNNGMSTVPQQLTNVNGTLFFVYDDGIHGLELWKSDGTANGTLLVKDVRPGEERSLPNDLTTVDGTLYFTADDGVHGRELWKSDGTEQGTQQVKDIYVDPSGTFPSSQFPDIKGLTNVSSRLFFSANDGVSGAELWTSDGTDEGTVRVVDLVPGVGGSNPQYLTSVDSTLFFSADTVEFGTELWKSDGTESGTVLVKNISDKFSSNPQELTDVNGSLFFTASDYDGIRSIWSSNGTEAGTLQIGSLSPGDLSDYSTALTNVNGQLFFTSYSPRTGVELWKLFDANTPSLTRILSQTTSEDVPTDAIPFTLSDIDTAVDDLTISVTSSDQDLIPDGNITISGTGANRTVVVTPAANQHGVAQIVLTISDGSLSSARSFQVTVDAVDDPVVIVLSQEPLVVATLARRPVRIDAGATITDVDESPDTFFQPVLQVSGHSEADSLSVLKTAGIHVKGGNLLLGHRIIGTVVGGEHGETLSIRFTTSVKRNVLQSVIRSVGFRTTDTAGGDRILQVLLLNISGNPSVPGGRIIRVRPGK